MSIDFFFNSFTAVATYSTIPMKTQNQLCSIVCNIISIHPGVASIESIKWELSKAVLKSIIVWNRATRESSAMCLLISREQVIHLLSVCSKMSHRMSHRMSISMSISVSMSMGMYCRIRAIWTIAMISCPMVGSNRILLRVITIDSLPSILLYKEDIRHFPSANPSC